MEKLIDIRHDLIDVSYDFRTDANGRDVDKYSATLRNYHKILWSKMLPNGNIFSLEAKKGYLYCKIEAQEYFLSSDAIVHTYSEWKRMKNIIKQIPEDEFNDFLNIAYTIGGYIIFPSKKINKSSTINQERGTNQKIDDRFDITLECIRRYYNNETSPLGETLQRYESFFKLFVDFKGYCDFFLLQDLTLDNYSTIKYFLPFNDFELHPRPKTVEYYKKYKDNAIEFNKNRNKRIQDYINYSS
ncbi:MAG: hypothetical protein LBC02_00475 [Planctomycetaceae bacterium]|jgi:hypothetical protein|nr:hypothetical protein [Planctomycetaceae bacterium]